MQRQADDTSAPPAGEIHACMFRKTVTNAEDLFIAPHFTAAYLCNIRITVN